jgi:hypothetical protein
MFTSSLSKNWVHAAEADLEIKDSSAIDDLLKPTFGFAWLPVLEVQNVLRVL